MYQVVFYHVLVVSIKGVPHNSLYLTGISGLLYLTARISYTCLVHSGDPSVIIIVSISKDLGEFQCPLCLSTMIKNSPRMLWNVRSTMGNPN